MFPPLPIHLNVKIVLQTLQCSNVRRQICFVFSFKVASITVQYMRLLKAASVSAQSQTLGCYTMATPLQSGYIFGADIPLYMCPTFKCVVCKLCVCSICRRLLKSKYSQNISPKTLQQKGHILHAIDIQEFESQTKKINIKEFVSKMF